MEGSDEGNKGRTPRRGTLAWLAEQSWEKGLPGVLDALASHLRDPADLAPYVPLGPGQGRKAYRNDLDEKDDSIIYRDFSAPPLWGPTFSILRVSVSDETDHEYLFHGAEEILIPISKYTEAGQLSAHVPGGETEEAISYTFVYAYESRPTVLPPAIVPIGSAIRINPQVGHHASAVGDAGTVTSAWMIMRAVTDSAFKMVATDVGYAPVRPVRGHRSANAADLEDAATYAAVSWGLSEHIRAYRQRADLSVTRLAEICKVEPALISRLEGVYDDPDTKDINISLDALVRIAAYLAIPLPSLIARAQLPNPFEMVELVGGAASEIISKPILGATIPHELHVTQIDIPAGGRRELPKACCFRHGHLAAWIVLRGFASIWLDVNNPLAVDERQPVGLHRAREPLPISEGSVIHFRHAAPREVSAQLDTQVIQVVHSTQCTCSADY